MLSIPVLPLRPLTPPPTCTHTPVGSQAMFHHDFVVAVRDGFFHRAVSMLTDARYAQAPLSLNLSLSLFLSFLVSLSEALTQGLCLNLHSQLLPAHTTRPALSPPLFFCACRCHDV